MYCTSDKAPQEVKVTKDTSVGTAPGECGCWCWRVAAEAGCHRSVNVVCLVGKGVSSYVILTKGGFIGRNQYSKL